MESEEASPSNPSAAEGNVANDAAAVVSAAAAAPVTATTSTVAAAVTADLGSSGGGNKDSSPSSPPSPQFLVGVVEGFYGRPWTSEQRKDLFSKMRAWGLTSYLYAPKDDCKHRAYWRQSYTVEEAEHLQSLVAMATECGIDFYYAISPGLDITYSSAKEVACLKRKLDQVSYIRLKSSCACHRLMVLWFMHVIGQRINVPLELCFLPTHPLPSEPDPSSP